MASSERQYTPRGYAMASGRASEMNGAGRAGAGWESGTHQRGDHPGRLADPLLGVASDLAGGFRNAAPEAFAEQTARPW